LSERTLKDVDDDDDVTCDWISRVPRRRRRLSCGSRLKPPGSSDSTQPGSSCFAGLESRCEPSANFIASDRSAAWNAIYPGASNDRMSRRGAQMHRICLHCLSSNLCAITKRRLISLGLHSLFGPAGMQLHCICLQRKIFVCHLILPGSLLDYGKHILELLLSDL